VSSSVDDEDLAKRAVEVILYYDLPIDLEGPAEEVFFEVLRSLPYRRRLRQVALRSNLVDRLPRPLALRFLCTLQQHSPRTHDRIDIWSFMGLPVHELPVPTVDIEGSREPAIIVIPPSWLGFSIS
jgi:hypothetical protein